MSVRTPSRIARLVLASVLMLLAPIAAGARAEQPAVDLSLVLAVDASGSVNQYRFDLQKKGYALAFRDMAVQRAIQSGPNHAIAVSMVQWTGPAMQIVVVPWTLVGDSRSAAAFADAIDASQRKLFGGGTSISGAIDHARRQFAASPFSAPRRVIDISGDGANNAGRLAQDARDEAIKAGIVINGLPILTLEPELDKYYALNVIGGPNAFVIAVRSYEEFGEAIRRKLILEIAAAGAGPSLAAARPERVGNAR